MVLILGSGVFSHLISKDYAIAGERPEIVLSSKILLAIAYTLSAWMTFVFWDELKQKFNHVCVLWIALLVWTFISVVFGQFNFSSLIRLLGFVGCTFMGVMLYANTQNVRQVINYLFWTCAFIVVLNFVYIDWSVLTSLRSKNIDGVFFQKNMLGHFAFMAMFISGFVIASNTSIMRWGALIVFIAAAWLLYLSTSMTSNLLIVVALLSIAGSLIISRYQKGWLVITASVVMLSLLLLFNWTEFFSLIGKNTTFTSRTSIWTEYWALIEQRIFIGHGYGAYPEKLSTWLRLGFHSGYIATMYYLGVIGAAIMLILIVGAVKSWWNIVRRAGFMFEACFLIGFISLLLMLNVTESYFFNRSGLVWPLFVYATLQLTFLSKLVKKRA